MPAARDEHAQHRLAGSGRGQQRVDVRLDRAEVELEAQVARGARHPREMTLAHERHPRVHAHHLEHALAAHEPGIGDRQARPRQRHDRAVEARELRIARAHPRLTTVDPGGNGPGAPSSSQLPLQRSYTVWKESSWGTVSKL